MEIFLISSEVRNMKKNKNPVIRDSDIPWIDKAIATRDGVCPHRCEWKTRKGQTASCWVESMRGRFPTKPIIGDLRRPEDYISRLERDLGKILPEPILVCHRIDPYPPIEKFDKITRWTLQMLLNYQWTPIILTKSSLIERDLPYLAKVKDADFAPWIGMTFTSQTWSLLYEKASPLFDRIRSLIIAKHLGLKTWISWEPLDPALSLSSIIEILQIVEPDYAVFGSLNKYSKSIEDYGDLPWRLSELLWKMELPAFMKKEFIKDIEPKLREVIKARNTVPWMDEAWNKARYEATL